MAYTNIDDPSAHFQAKRYAGNGVDNTAITNDGNSNLQPDFIWFARYDTPGDKFLLNSSSGVTKFLVTSATGPEGTATSLVKSFDTNGFTVGTNSNTNAISNYIAWQLKANGGTTSSNTNGTITSTVQANTDAGFSIGTFTGNGTSGATVGHGLGVKPDMLILKSKNNPSGAAMYWIVGHVGLDGMAGTKNLFMDQTWAVNTESVIWANTAPTSSVFSVGTNAAVNYTGNNMLFYAFAEKQGYSKFGKYTGNGSTNGPFVYTGFKPAVVLFKRTDTTSNWTIITGATIQKNVINERFTINLGNIQGVADWVDFISNGFKLRTTNEDLNASGGTYIYMAFAENPFVTSTGIPTTAR